MRSTFHDALIANDFRVEVYDDFVGRLEGFLGPQRPLKITDLEQQGLEQLLSRYVLSEPGRVRIVTYLFLADKRWKREPPPGLAEAIAAGDSRIVVTGTNVVNREFRHIFMREAPRAEAFEISATGPIFGTRVRQPSGAVAARERAALEARGIDLENLRPPRGIRLRGARRALRVQPAAVGVERVSEGLRLDFTLPPGSYATVLVAELIDDPDGSDDIAPRAAVS